MTTHTSWRVGLWTVLIALIALGGVASAQSGQGYGSRITVYADINFAGQSASFDGDTPNLVSAGWNDNISSLRVPNGETWEICVDENFGNQCQAVTGSVADLRSMGWNDRISSIRRINNTNGRRVWGGRDPNENNDAGVTVYADPNFGGRSHSFRGDTPNMVSAGWNDTISSIRIASGETWEICQDVDYGNQCRTLSGDVADLRGIGWDDRISSLRRSNDDGPRGRGWGRGNNGNNRNNGNSAGVTVYANPNYRGQSATFRNDTPNLVSFNLNDKVSSIRIPNGETWEVCQDINYESQCQVLSASVTDLGRNGWGDRISSLRRVNDRGFGNRQTGTSGAFGNMAQRGLLFFDRAGFRGNSTPISMGSSRMGVPAWHGSVQIRGGGAWELCDTSDNCETIDQDVSDLSYLGLNDRIVSARPVNNYRR